MTGFQRCFLIGLSLVSSHLYAQSCFYTIRSGAAMFEVEKMCGRPVQRDEKEVCSSTQSQAVASLQSQIGRSASIGFAGPSGQNLETTVVAGAGVNRTDTHTTARSVTNTAQVCRKLERWIYKPSDIVTRVLFFTDGILSETKVEVK